LLPLAPLAGRGWREAPGEGLLIGEERLTEAIEILRRGLAVDPEGPELNNTIGNAYSSPSDLCLTQQIGWRPHALTEGREAGSAEMTRLLHYA